MSRTEDFLLDARRTSSATFDNIVKQRRQSFGGDLYRSVKTHEKRQRKVNKKLEVTKKKKTVT